ncbi:MAG TPA: hypothetical protein VD966_07230 [Pyrinomonadaceae bacterium]|nr:hypothetical protein [Pyrinomonadaceae bacterium]
MKRIFVTLMCLVVLAVAAIPAGAQTRQRRYSDNVRAAQQSRYDRDQRSRYDYDRYRDDRSIWEKHRDKITTAGGAAGGAILGGVIGGKKGAVIGAIAGGAGAALYTYKIRKNDRRY